MEGKDILKLFDSINIPKLSDYQKGKKDYKCDICEKIIVGFPSTLRKHKQLIHGENNPVLECNVCKKTFKRKGDLNVHTRNHDKEPQFECQYCKKKMNKKANLKKHEEKFCESIDKSNLIFQCTKCLKKFFLESSRDRHEQTHDESPVQCHVCHEFKSKSNLKSHIKVVHQQIKPFECCPCKMKFSEQNTLNRHLKAYCKSRSREKTFKCNYLECKSSFDADIKLKSHIRKNHINPLTSKEKRFFCECGIGFRAKTSLKVHKLSHGDPQYECKDCDRKFFNQNYLKNHRKNVHNPDIQAVKCDVCKNTFKSETVLKSHTRRMHSAASMKTFNCSNCERAFKTRPELERHERIHTGTKDEKCPICGKGFRTKGMVWAHKFVHRKTKDFQCNMCDRSFKYHMSLQRHQKRDHYGQTVTDPNIVLLSTLRQTCDLCGKEVLKLNMKTHLKYHDKLPEFECSKCNFASKVKESLQRHIRRVHGAIKCQNCGKGFSKHQLLTNHKKRNECSSNPNPASLEVASA